ncbi:MAG: uncharacterized protein QG670_929 [Thermoproteota archaeon]|nr:uncharacterized protein [Thermoproteota archaeon]
MAVDVGLIRTDEDAIGIEGTGGGADTALIVRPSNTHTFFNIKIKEIISLLTINFIIIKYRSLKSSNYLLGTR